MAMGIKYPPILPSTMPAFKAEVGNNDIIIKIPFTHNDLNTLDTLEDDQVPFMSKITTMNGEVIKPTAGKTISKDLKSYDFPVSKNLFQPYNYYKFYLRYNYPSQHNPWSNPTVGLYLGEVSLNNFFVLVEQSKVDHNIYVGTYTHSEVPAEKEFSCTFVLKDEEGNIIKDTGILYHDSKNDESPNINKDYFWLDYEIPEGEIYTLTYSVTTINGLFLKTEEQIRNTSQLTTLNTNAILNYNFYFAPPEYCCNAEDGTISIKVFPCLKENDSSIINGQYKLQRSDERNPNIWRTITTFSLNMFGLYTENEKLLKSEDYITILKDFSVASGVVYNYRIIKYNAYDMYTQPIGGIKQYSVTFEGNFLGDGQRQLNINFNPQMSSFKTNILQNKVETIGSKYPWINRNGIVNYKEFPLSGLISYHTDPNFLFISEKEAKELQIYNYNRARYRTSSNEEKDISNRTFNLSDINFKAEQYFKLKVLDFLNDGNIKLFRSATEGNYFVRIMNVSLAPQQTLGRMLHTFSCTAYEVEEINNENIKPYWHLSTNLLEERNFSPLQLINSPESVIQKSINDIFRHKGVFLKDKQKKYIKTFDIDGPIGAVIELLLQSDINNSEEHTIVIREIIGVTGRLTVDMTDTPYHIIQIGMPYYSSENNKNYTLVPGFFYMQENNSGEGLTANNFLSNHSINLILHNWYKAPEKILFDYLLSETVSEPIFKAGFVRTKEEDDDYNYTHVFLGGFSWVDSDRKQNVQLLDIYLLRLTNMTQEELEVFYVFGPKVDDEISFDNNTTLIIPPASSILLWGPECSELEIGEELPEVICLRVENSTNDKALQYEFLSKQSTTYYSSDYWED